MKILSKSDRELVIKLAVTSIDDLWYLSHIIDKNDVLSGRTLRKVAVEGKGDERAKASSRKPMFLAITVEKVDFSNNDSLRVLGNIIDGPDSVPKGDHHTFNIVVGDEISIRKDKWLSFHNEWLNRATKDNSKKILIVAFDRDEATLGTWSHSQIKILAELKGDVQKKADGATTSGKNFYEELYKTITTYDSRLGFFSIVLAPRFGKTNF